MSDDPTIFVIGKINPFECICEGRSHLLPVITAIHGSQDCSAATDRKTFVIVTKIYAKQSSRHTRTLYFPVRTAVLCGEDKSFVTNDPAMRIAVKIEMEKFIFLNALVGQTHPFIFSVCLRDISVSALHFRLAVPTVCGHPKDWSRPKDRLFCRTRWL